MLNSYLTGGFFGQAILCLTIPLHVYLLKKGLPKSSITMSKHRPRNQRPKLHERMMKSIHDLYSQDTTFLDELANDLEDGAVWFNNSEFARFHNINGVKILSVFTSDSRSKKINIRIGSDENPEGISKAGGILYCRAQEISEVNAEQPLRLDGKLYTVSEARLIQDNVWRIVLEANSV